MYILCTLSFFEIETVTRQLMNNKKNPEILSRFSNETLHFIDTTLTQRPFRGLWWFLGRRVHIAACTVVCMHDKRFRDFIKHSHTSHKPINAITHHLFHSTIVWKTYTRIKRNRTKFQWWKPYTIHRHLFARLRKIKHAFSLFPQCKSNVWYYT